MSFRIIYNKETGKIIKCRGFSDKHLAENLKLNPTWAYIDGQLDPKSLKDFRVDVNTGALEEIIRPFDAGFYIRIERKRLLDASDWSQMPDNGLSEEKKLEWQAYRQALRDMPDTYMHATSAADIVWPTKP